MSSPSGSSSGAPPPTIRSSSTSATRHPTTADRERDDLKYVEGADGETAKFGTPARPDDVKGRFDDVIAEAPGADWTDPTPGDKPEYLPAVDAQPAERDAMRSLARQRAEALYVVDQAVGAPSGRSTPPASWRTRW